MPGKAVAVYFHSQIVACPELTATLHQLKGSQPVERVAAISR